MGFDNGEEDEQNGEMGAFMTIVFSKYYSENISPSMTILHNEESCLKIIRKCTCFVKMKIMY